MSNPSLRIARAGKEIGIHLLEEVRRRLADGHLLPTDHQTPPFLGQGMCAALRDVSNLAWKLEAVVRGRSPDSLLDSYESERSPHVHAFIELAVRLGDIIQATDPDKARERDARFRAGQPEIFEFPAPRLGPGLVSGASALVGRPFGQPRLDDGRLLDAALGNRLAVIAYEDVLREVSDSTRRTWAAWNAVPLPATDASLRDWLAAQGVKAVILRPDRYILGLATTAVQLDELSACLPLVETQTT